MIRRVLAFALCIRLQGCFDVLGRLAADHGHLIYLGISGLIAADAVASDTHCDLVAGFFRVAHNVRGCGQVGNAREREKCE